MRIPLLSKKYSPLEELIVVLKKRPDEIFVTPHYMAMWNSNIGSVIVIAGHYMELTQEEASLIFKKTLTGEE